MTDLINNNNFQESFPPIYKSDFFSIRPSYNVPSVPLIFPPCNPNTNKIQVAGSRWILPGRHHWTTIWTSQFVHNDHHCRSHVHGVRPRYRHQTPRGLVGHKDQGCWRTENMGRDNSESDQPHQSWNRRDGRWNYPFATAAVVRAFNLVLTLFWCRVLDLRISRTKLRERSTGKTQSQILQTLATEKAGA